MQSTYTLNSREMTKTLAALLEARLVPFIQSSPGMGKSSIVRALAKAANLFLIDHRISTSDPTDFSGLPGFDGQFAVMKPFREIFPLEDTPIPEGYSGWLLFFDEFNSGKKETQAAAYKTILDHQVGQHRLHPECYKICAGNMASDRAIVNSLSTAMQSRLIHLELALDFDIWYEDVALTEDYDVSIRAFLNQNKTKLFDFQPDHEEKTFCCPRTWEFLNRQVKVTGGPVEWMSPAYAGTITSAVALEYIQFCKVFNEVPKKDDVLNNPMTCILPSNASICWATVCSMNTWWEPKHSKALATYVDRLELTFQILFWRTVVFQHPEFRDDPLFATACVKVSNYLN